MTPASLAIIEAAFRPGDRTRAIGTWAASAGYPPRSAPFLGGWLLQAGSWRPIFLINVPVAAAMVGHAAACPRIPGHVGLRESRLARRAGRRRRAGRDHLRDHRPAGRGCQVAAVRRRRGARRGFLGRLRRHRTARQPSHAPAGDLRSGAVPRRQRRHLRRQRRPRRLRVRLHPRPGDHRRRQPGRGGLGSGTGHRRDHAAVGTQRPASAADRPPTANSGPAAWCARWRPRSPCASAPTPAHWTAVFPVAVLFGLGLASLIPPLTASAMNSAPDTLSRTRPPPSRPGTTTSSSCPCCSSCPSYPSWPCPSPRFPDATGQRNVDQTRQRIIDRQRLSTTLTWWPPKVLSSGSPLRSALSTSPTGR